MGRTACTDPQCLYKGAIFFILLIQVCSNRRPLKYNAPRIVTPIWGIRLIIQPISHTKFLYDPLVAKLINHSEFLCGTYSIITAITKRQNGPFLIQINIGYTLTRCSFQVTFNIMLCIRSRSSKQRLCFWGCPT